MSARDQLLLDLPRPQYAANSEVLLSALVQPLYQPADGSRRGYWFLGRGGSGDRVQTGPRTPDELSRFGAELQRRGLRTNGTSHDLAKAVQSAITGVGASRSTTIPAAPMSPHLALAQNPSGVLGASAPNLGQALEHMFLMGEPTRPPDGTTSTAPVPSMAELWLNAARARCANEPLLADVDAAFADIHPGGPFTLREQPPTQRLARQWQGAFPESPFGWLNRSWRRITDPGWSGRLPTRVWTDWATAVLRTSLALGYLAEMHWYVLLGRQLLGEEPITRLPAMRRNELLPWPPARLPVGSRNVKAEIRQATNQGTLMRELLQDLLPDTDAQRPTDALEALRPDEDVRKLVRRALSGHEAPKSTKNVYETIVYALQERGGGSTIDYYGLLKTHGTRYSVVAPGTEWIAVVASLACDESGQTNIGEVMASLRRLGLHPELQEVVRALEAAGLARGSADADHGVRVRSAF